MGEDLRDLLDECLRESAVRADSPLLARASVFRALSDPCARADIQLAVCAGVGGHARCRQLLLEFIDQVVEYFIWHEDLRSSGFPVLPSLLLVRTHSVRDAMATLCASLACLPPTQGPSDTSAGRALTMSSAAAPDHEAAPSWAAAPTASSADGRATPAAPERDGRATPAAPERDGRATPAAPERDGRATPAAPERDGRATPAAKDAARVFRCI